MGNKFHDPEHRFDDTTDTKPLAHKEDSVAVDDNEDPFGDDDDPFADDLMVESVSLLHGYRPQGKGSRKKKIFF